MTTYLDALDNLVDSRPMLEPGNYATWADYRADQRGNMQARNDYWRIRACIAPDDATMAYLAHGSRIDFEHRDDGMNAYYTAGQYYPVEYRPAAVRLLANAWWQSRQNEYTSADKLRKIARHVFGRGIARRWFS